MTFKQNFNFFARPSKNQDFSYGRMIARVKSSCLVIIYGPNVIKLSNLLLSLDTKAKPISSTLLLVWLPKAGGEC